MKPAGSLPGGVVTQYGVGAITVFMLLFLTYWILFGGGEPAELPSAGQTQQAAPKSFTDRMADQVDTETLRAKTRKAAEDRILRAQQQQQADTAGIGGGRVTAKEAILLAGTSPRHRPTLHPGRMGLARELALGSTRKAQPFASQFTNRADLPQTRRRGSGGGREARRRNERPPRSHDSARRRRAPTGSQHDWNGYKRPRRSNCGRRSGRSSVYRSTQRNTRRGGVRADHSYRVSPTPARVAIILPLPASESRKTPPAGSESMKAHSSKPCLCRNSPVTSPARCWPWLPFLSTRRIGSAS